MGKVSIIGLGWLGLDLAQYLQSINISVVGSKSSMEGVEKSRAEGIDSLLFNTTLGFTLKSSAVQRLFQCEILVITLPPSHRYGSVSYPIIVGAIAKTAEYCGAQHIIFTSSTSVYGQQSTIVDERSLLAPKTESANAIVVAERELLTKINANVSIVRLGGLFGGSRLPKNWIQNKDFIDRPNQRVNLIHRNDAIVAISEIIKQKGEGKQIYNIVSPQHPTRREFYTNIASGSDISPLNFIEDADDSIKYYGYVNGSKLTDKYHVEYQHSIYE